MSDKSMVLNLCPLEKIKELQPAFSNGYGWLSIAELNLIDPNCDRFQIAEEVIFVDKTMFVSVVPMVNVQTL